MAKISFISGDESLIDEIQTLWESLNRLHYEKSPHFKDYYAGRTFDERRRDLLAKSSGGRLRITLARDGHGNNIGYCVSAITGQTGEIESIYLDPSCRKHGVGKKLMEDSLEWLKTMHAANITVKVSTGNEEAFGFYEKFGFYPRLTELKLK